MHPQLKIRGAVLALKLSGQGQGRDTAGGQDRAVTEQDRTGRHSVPFAFRRFSKRHFRRPKEEKNGIASRPVLQGRHAPQGRRHVFWVGVQVSMKGPRA